MLPNEILVITFQHLSHRFLAQISLVCKEWYLISRSPLFYHTLYIQNKKQLFKFIATTTLINNKHPGHFAQHLVLDDYFQWDPLITTDLELISVSCPNLFRINAEENMLLSGSLSLTENSIWQRLTYLPLWFTDKNEDWYKMVQQDNRYVSLEFAITPGMFQPTAVTDNCDHQHKPFIHIQNDPHLQTQKWDENFTHGIATNGFEDMVKNIIQNIDGVEYIYYQSKIFLFSTTFMHLKHLLLNFGSYSAEYNHHILPYSLELDERTIEAIHRSCPVLESLELDMFFMNISTQYKKVMDSPLALLPTSTALSVTKNPCLFLKKLSLMHIHFFHQNCFHFFATKYPNLVDLSLCLIIDFEMGINEIKKEAYKRGFLEMLSAYTSLSKLSLNFAIVSNPCSYSTPSMREEAWINEDFIFWLANRPDMLMDFKYEDYIEEFIDTAYQRKEECKGEMKQKYIYIDRINKLNLYYISSNTILFFEKMAHSGINYDCLTELVIQNFNNTWSGIDFKIYEWLDLLPNLKKLSLKDNQTLPYNPCLRSTIDLRQETDQQQNKTYRLEELEIKHANILLRNGFTYLGLSCPSLHTFKLNSIYIEDDCFEHQKTTDVIVMDTPHLKLNQLFIRNFMTPSTLDNYGNKIRPLRLIVTETKKIYNNNHNQPFVINIPAYDQKYCIKHKMEYMKNDFLLKESADDEHPNIKILLNCEYVDMICCINF